MKTQVKINDKDYTLQKLPVKQAFEMRNTWIDSGGGVDQAKMYNLVLEHLVISPRMKLEDFEEMWELDELVGEAIEFQYGKKK